MRTIDADAHVIETSRTWEYMKDGAVSFRPVEVETPDGEVPEGRAQRQNQFWAIDGRLVPRERNIGLDTTVRDTREMRDIDRRLAHMDDLAIDVQILYPSLFLRPLTRKAEVELALVRGYNRWLGDIWRKGGGRLRWVALAPVRSLHDPAVVRDELTEAKANGACGVFMCGFSCDREAWTPYFHPLYAIAQDLDLAVCFHAGVDSTPVHDFFEFGDGLAKFKFPVISALHSLLLRGVPERFPALRWGFIEAGSAWLPYVLGELKRRFRRRGKRMSEDTLRSNNMWIACQVTEDLDYIVRWAGEGQLVVGTDYGHNDTSTEIEAMRVLRDEKKLNSGVIDKILGANASALYGLS
ncbi:MAG: amidohydrolase family protein [Alphaproteobacteria bacterium]|nr:amidohydrolase family protein [Alphaproteobacteria bacterium]